MDPQNDDGISGPLNGYKNITITLLSIFSFIFNMMWNDQNKYFH